MHVSYTKCNNNLGHKFYGAFLLLCQNNWYLFPHISKTKCKNIYGTQEVLFINKTWLGTIWFQEILGSFPCFCSLYFVGFVVIFVVSPANSLHVNEIIARKKSTEFLFVQYNNREIFFLSLNVWVHWVQNAKRDSFILIYKYKNERERETKEWISIELHGNTCKERFSV